MFGKCHSVGTKVKISKSLKGHSYNVGRIYSVEDRIKMSESLKGKMSGKKHPLYDFNIYTFFNKKTKETFVGTKFNFYTLYNLDKSIVCSIVKNKKPSIKGWVLTSPSIHNL